MQKIDELVRDYLKLRTMKEDLAKAYKEKDLFLKEKMETLGNTINQFLNDTGQDFAPTKYGTAHRIPKSSVKITDRHLLNKFILEHGAADLLQGKVTKTVYDAYVIDGIEVPGVAVDTWYDISVRSK